MMTTGAQAITTIHLVILAVLAILAVAGIVWGMKLRRERRAGIERREEHQAEIEAAPSTNTAPREERAQAHAPVHSEAAPIAAAAPERPTEAPIATETPIATEMPAAAESGAADQPVTILKGLGPKLAARLGELGITTIGDIATLDAARAEALDAQLGAFTGRMARDRWIEQARFLAAGDRAGFEATFGKL